MDTLRNREACRARRQHGGEEHLGAEPLVSGGGFEMGAVLSALAWDLVPELLGERSVPPAELGKEGAYHHQTHQVRRVVIGADRARLLQVPRRVGAVLIEE